MICDPYMFEMVSHLLPPSDKEKHGTRYTNLTVLHKQGEVEGPTEAELEFLSSEIVRRHPSITPEMLATTIEKARGNKGLYQFFLDYGMYSDFFIPWLMKIPNAISLEVAFGYGYNIDGEWCHILFNDAFYWWIIREGMFIYLRERAVNTAKLIQDRENVLILGAGYLPELRYVGYEPAIAGGGTQKIVAVDSDASIPGSKLLSESLAKVPNVSVDYRTGNLINALKDGTELHDAVIMNGVMSYCYDKMLDILWLAIGRLKYGGTFMFDLQLKEWNIVRDALVFDWKTDPPMKLIENEQEVINQVNMRCRNLPVQVGSFVDSNHQSITFRITRCR